jgi:hypothetical protein
VDAVGRTETVVLLDANGKLLPVSTFVFGVSSGPKRRVEQRYMGSLILYRDGAVKNWSNKFLGLMGHIDRPADAERCQRRNSARLDRSH